MMAAIANGGTVYRPHVVRMIEKTNPDGNVERLQVAPRGAAQSDARAERA